MANEITGTTTTYDREKMLASQLISRSHIRMVAASLCDKVKMKEGAGETAYFVRYSRMNLPTDPLSDDGDDPANSSFSLEEFSVALDEWGDVITITSRAILTTSHPLVQQAMDLLADNAARVMDREIQLVWLANSNVRYGDGSVTSRRTITSSMKLSEDVILGARVQLVNDGAPPRGVSSKDAHATNASGMYTGGASYVAVAGPEVLADISRPSVSLGTWAAVATYANAKALYNFEVGTWMNIRWVETNFIPQVTRLGNTTVAAEEGSNADMGVTGFDVAETNAAGTLANGTYYWKAVRKSLTRGLPDEVSIEHTVTTAGADDTVTFTMGSASGYVWDIYVGSSTGDSNLFLLDENVAASGTVTLLTVPATGDHPPESLRASGDGSDPTTIHVVYIHAAESCKWVGFYDAKFHVTKDESIIGNVLRRKRALGYNFFGKAIVPDTTRLLRLEVASTF